MILFIIAYILYLPLTMVNYICVAFTAKDNAKGYFRVSAINFDKYGNKELKTFTIGPGNSEWLDEHNKKMNAYFETTINSNHIMVIDGIAYNLANGELIKNNNKIIIKKKKNGKRRI